MTGEYGALLANDSWELIPPPANANILSGKWVFRHKLKTEGTLDRYKAHWVLRGFSQEHDVDFDETFSPVVKLTCYHPGYPLRRLVLQLEDPPTQCQERLSPWETLRVSVLPPAHWVRRC